jgi:biotin operon repressor
MSITAIQRVRTMHDLLKILMHHVGHARAESSRNLAKKLRCSQKRIHELVTELRLQGIVVCGQRDAGYFIAATREELFATCAFLRARAVESLEQEAKLRNVRAADLTLDHVVPALWRRDRREAVRPLAGI